MRDWQVLHLYSYALRLHCLWYNGTYTTTHHALVVLYWHLPPCHLQTYIILLE